MIEPGRCNFCVWFEECMECVFCHHTARLQPLAPMEAFIQEILLTAFQRTSNVIVHELFRRLIIRIEDLRISIEIIEDERDVHQSIGPAGAAVGKMVHLPGYDRHFWCDVRQTAFFGLQRDHIVQEFLQERVRVAVVVGCLGEDVDVTGPAGTFPCWTVGGDLHGIGAPAPLAVLHKLVDLFVGAGESTSFHVVGIDRDGSKVFRIDGLRPVRQLSIAVAADQELRLVLLLSILQRIGQDLAQSHFF